MPSPEQDRPSQAEIDEHYADMLHQAWSDAKDVFELGEKVIVTRGYHTDRLGVVVGAGVELENGSPVARIRVRFDFDGESSDSYSVNDLEHMP
jgi:hypothetical protein